MMSMLFSREIMRESTQFNTNREGERYVPACLKPLPFQKNYDRDEDKIRNACEISCTKHYKDEKD
jgi:hypothetical protein